MADRTDRIENKIIGANLRRLRLLANISQSDVAQHVGVSFQQVQKYEKGVNRLPVTTLLALKELYGISWDLFFVGLPAGETSDFRLALPEDDEQAARLFRYFSRVEDPRLKKKIIRVVNILTTP